MVCFRWIYSERKRFFMAKNQKKGLIALALLLVVTLVISYFGIAGTVLGPEQSRRLLPYMPMNGDMDAYTLPVQMDGGVLYEITLPASETDLSDEACAVMEARLKEYGVRNYKVEKESAELIKVTTPFYSEAEVLGTMLSAGGQFTFTDANGNELLTNEDFTSTDVLYANGYYYLEMNAAKADIKAATEATAGSTMPIMLDGQQLAAPQVDEVTTQGKITLSFGMSEAYTRALAAMLVSDPMPVVVSNATMSVAEATAPASLTAVLVALWVMFAAACVLFVVRFRVVGLGAAWTLWAYMLLFFFLLCTVTKVMVDVPAWICVFAGVVVTVYVLCNELCAAKKAVQEGRDVAAAVRFGLNSTVKHTLLVYAVVLAVALVLMVFAFTRPYGYVLSTVVASGAAVALVLVRVLVPVVVSAFGGKTCLIAGKSSDK